MDINKQINELKALQEKHRKQLKENRDKVLERKRRAHRLIVRGAIAEKYVTGAEKLTNEEFKCSLEELIKSGQTDTKTVPQEKPSAERTTTPSGGG